MSEKDFVPASHLFQSTIDSELITWFKPPIIHSAVYPTLTTDKYNFVYLRN